jgi:hypothetical protein
VVPGSLQKGILAAQLEQQKTPSTEEQISSCNEKNKLER